MRKDLYCWHKLITFFLLLKMIISIEYFYLEYLVEKQEKKYCFSYCSEKYHFKFINLHIIFSSDRYLLFNYNRSGSLNLTSGHLCEFVFFLLFGFTFVFPLFFFCIRIVSFPKYSFRFSDQRGLLHLYGWSRRIFEDADSPVLWYFSFYLAKQ